MRLALSLAMTIALLGNYAFGTSITVSPTPPVAGSIDIRQTGADDGSDMVRRADDGTAANHQWFGQTFTVPVGGMTVDKVAYMFSQEVDPTGRMTSGMTMGAVIYNAAGLGSTSGAVVSSQQAVTPSFTQGVTYWMTLDMDNVVLAAGTYGINFDFAFPLNNGAGGHKISNSGMYFIGDGNDNYTGGQGWRISGTGANNFNDLRDLAFVVTGFAAPEPSSFVLAGLGIVGMVGVAYRRRKA